MLRSVTVDCAGDSRVLPQRPEIQPAPISMDVAMMNRPVFTLCLPLVCCLSAVAGEKVPGPIAERGELLFSDDFQREGLGDWKVIIPGFHVTDGVLVGTQDRQDHGSVGRVYLPMKDVVVSFRFKLAGSPRFNVVFDDKNHKGSHAGHICRVAVARKQVRLGDDKEGIMRNDIFAMRREPRQKAAAAKLLEGRSSTVQVDLQVDRWYTMQIEILADQMRVSLDGRPIGYLKSPGLAHPTKESLHFTVTGKETHFDDVKIWRAAPN
jgi:hypothetical protein